jgi:putative transposase
MDFTCVFDAKGIQIFIFAIIEVPSRKLILINSTANPTREWVTQQFRNTAPAHEFPASMVHDRDGIFGHWLPKVLREFGCKSIKTPPRSPWQNPFIERFYLTIKTEMLNRVALKDNNHIRELCISFLDFYNMKRPHQGISGRIPGQPSNGNPTQTIIENLRVKKNAAAGWPRHTI